MEGPSSECFGTPAHTILAILLASTALADTQPVEVPESLTAPACVACNVDPTAVRRIFSDTEWKALERREVVTSERPTGDRQERKVFANAIIHRSPQQVWTVLTDFPGRPKFVPDVDDMRVVRVDGQRVWVDEYLSFLFMDIHFRVINTLEPERGMMSWELDQSAEHDIADTKGSWQLTPVADGKHTLLSYWNDLDTGQPVPGFIERYLLDSSLPRLLGQMRDEAERRFPA